MLTYRTSGGRRTEFNPGEDSVHVPGLDTNLFRVSSRLPQGSVGRLHAGLPRGTAHVQAIVLAIRRCFPNDRCWIRVQYSEDWRDFRVPSRRDHHRPDARCPLFYRQGSIRQKFRMRGNGD